MTAADQLERPLEWYNRYARHLALDQVGEEGQVALNAAQVMVLGAGGLGSPIALYLAAAGVGTLGLVDFDLVSVNNLQRQILHGTPDIGRHKVDSATETLAGINPEVKVRKHRLKLEPDNIWELINAYDIVVDGSDNYATRFLVNDVCHQAGKPLVFGAVLQFSGQVTTFTREPDCCCYRCIFPAAPDPEFVQTCVDAGIFGAVTGIIGSIQATEVLKLILNNSGNVIGPVLKNRLLLYDGTETAFREMALRRNPDCPVCANPDFDFRKVDYVDSCAISNDRAMAPSVTVD